MPARPRHIRQSAFARTAPHQGRPTGKLDEQEPGEGKVHVNFLGQVLGPFDSDTSANRVRRSLRAYVKRGGGFEEEEVEEIAELAARMEGRHVKTILRTWERGRERREP